MELWVSLEQLERLASLGKLGRELEQLASLGDWVHKLVQQMELLASLGRPV